MTTTYTAIIEVAAKGIPSDDAMEALANYHPALSTSQRGWMTAHITLPAENLAQAVTTATALVEAAYGAAAIACEVMTEAESDAREGLAPVPDLLSVTEVALHLGVSRQAVLDRIARHTLPAKKVGREYAIPRSALK